MALNPGFRPLSQQEKVDIKRESGKAPCAECKRLKLKCDKNIPCASCVRRGCGETCPTGTYLPTGRGRRAVPTESSRLKRAMSEMEDRIKELETAITTAYDDHLDYCPHLGISPTGPLSADELADSLGTLTVNNTDDTQYFGRTAGTEVWPLFHAGFDSFRLDQALLSIEADDPVIELSASTFTAVTDSFSLRLGRTVAWNAEQALTQLFVRLPSKLRASQLCEAYFENGCWSGTPIMRDELVELLAQVYSSFSAPDPACSVHQVAVLYGVFALGALVDLTLPRYNVESEYYFDLCRAALSVRSVFDDPTMATIQALVLVSVFYAHGGPKFSMESAWSLISVASHICQNMGLHAGRLQPGLTPKQIHRQRALFWETYSIETLQSLAVGRPTGTFLANISCPFPTKQIDDTGSIQDGYYRRRWQFVKEIAGPVMEMYLTADPPAYDVVVDLDQRIRKFVQSTTCTPLRSSDALNSPATYIQRTGLHQSCTIMLLYIHNNGFVHAIRENPAGPYFTPRAISYLAASRCASEIIHAGIENFARHAELFSRWWPVWKSLFNAAIIAGAVAAKCPQNKFAPGALLQLFVAVDLFERGAASSFRARNALPVLRVLRAKAIAAYTTHAGDNALGVDADAEEDAALDVFAGRTRVIAQNILSRTQCRQHVPRVYSVPPETAQGHWRTETAQGQMPDDSPPAIDASLVQYFTSAPGSGPSLPELDGGANPLAGGGLQDSTNMIPIPFLDVPPLPLSVSDAYGGEDACMLDEPEWTEFLETL
ncbi:hypothetical protein DFH09DRAFT_1457350 [Mycena vulgaris]|nr:hypothetical protein DFH09DRAFT_1457350 [Mycena vulgaris]